MRDARAMFTSGSSEWETPEDLYEKYNKIYKFTLDAAASHENAKCKKYYTAQDDGLAQSWGGETVWCNPPYGKQVGKWVEKAHHEAQKPGTIVVCLLPARVDTRWFHKYCKHASVEFICGRLRFGNCESNAPFPSMVVVFG